jgi:hypothetical protein
MFGITKYYDVGSSVGSGAATGATIGSVIPGLGTLAGGLIGGGIGLVSGLFQKKKGNDILKQNPYPTQTVPNEVLESKEIAQNMANEGMPSQQYEAAQKNIQRQQSAAIAQAQDRRSGVGAIGAIQQGTNDASGQLDAQSAAIRRQNQLGLINVNSQVGQYRNAAFDWNQKQKYISNFNYGMSLIGSGNQNMMSGIDKIGGGLIGAYSSGLFGGGTRQTKTNTVNSGGGNQYGSGQGDVII